MPRGSAPGERRGGRKKGTANKKTREIADKAAETGLLPLEYMLDLMRSPFPPELKDAIAEGNIDEAAVVRLCAWHNMRFEAAKSAAPYIHPKLQTNTIKGEGENGEIKLGMKIEYVAADNGSTARKA